MNVRAIMKAYELQFQIYAPQVRLQQVRVACCVSTSPFLIHVSFEGYFPCLSNEIPQRLAYKVHILVRASPISRTLNWSYIKGGLTAQFRHTNTTYPYLVYVLNLFCIALTVLNYRNLNDKMPKSGPKPKAINYPTLLEPIQPSTWSFS